MAAASNNVSGRPVDPDLDLGEEVALEGSPHPRRSRRAQVVIVVALGLGGVAGALSRYAVSRALPTGTAQFPWATFLINLSGSLVLGFLLILLLEQFPRGRLARPVISTGFIGAYTTFSTFTVEAVLLVRADHTVTAVLYVLTSTLAGLLAVWMGMTGARLVLQAERWVQEHA